MDGGKATRPAILFAVAAAFVLASGAGGHAQDDRKWRPVTGVREGAVRDVTGQGQLRVAPAPSGDMRRLPSRVTASPKPPPEPDWFHRVVIPDAGHFRSDGRVFALAGLSAPAADTVCPAAELRAEWPCGRRAMAAVRRFVRSRALECDPLPDAAPDGPRTCRVGGASLNEWIVAQGWASPTEGAHPDLRAAHRAAREAGRGMHGRPESARMTNVTRR